MELNRIAISELKEDLATFPCVAILGPRQVGKTSLSIQLQKLIDKDSIYLDMESDEDLAKIRNAEQYFKERKDKLIIIDEIQRQPQLLPLLRSVIDRKRQNGRFILLGSASPELLMQSSESLAGRISYLELHPLHFFEVKSQFTANELWLKGGFPVPFLENSLETSSRIRTHFIQTYIERELPLLGLSASPVVLKNLFRMLAHYHGQLIHYSELANSLGVQVNTVKRYIDYFENALLIRRLQPWSTNSGKRIVKSPRVYIRDSGLLHSLFHITTQEDLDGFHQKGFSWEGFVIQQIIAVLKPGIEPYFYRTQDGSEIDLVLAKGNKPIVALEIKVSNSPSNNKGTTIAAADLGNIPTYIITPSVNEDYSLKENITVTSFDRVWIYLEKKGVVKKVR